MIHPGDYKFSAESKGTGKFKIQVVVKGKKGTVTDSHKMLQGKSGPNSSFELEFQVTKNHIPLSFDVILTDKSPFLKKASYAFKLTKSDDQLVIEKKEEEGPKMKPLTKEQLEELNGEKKKEPEKKQQVVQLDKIKVKIELPNKEFLYNVIDPNEAYEETFQRLRREYGDKIMKYTDSEEDLVNINSGSDLKGFLENVEKGKVPKIKLFERKSGTPTEKEDTGSNGGTPLTPSQSSIRIIIPQNLRKIEPITHWQKGNKIGKGAFGVVYQGLNQDNGKLMAVKQVDLKGFNFSEDKLKALESEIDLLARLDHPNIVKYLGMQKTDEFLYIFLDYIPGGSIESILKTFKLKEPVVRRYTRQILLGLQYLHSQNIIHRDVKGGNVLVDEHGNVYLSDFGSAKKFTKELQKKEKVLEGTPNYMPPEVIIDSKYKKASDIYALGCTVLEMLTGLPPWHQYLDNFKSPYEFFFWRKEEKPKLEIPRDISEKAKSFLQACLQDYPENRKSATELLNHIFITGKEDDSDFDSEEEEEIKQEEKVEIKLEIPTKKVEVEIKEVEEYVDDGFDFDDIKPPSPIEDEKKPKEKLENEIKSFLKKNAEISNSFFKK